MAVDPSALSQTVMPRQVSIHWMFDERYRCRRSLSRTSASGSGRGRRLE